MRVEAFAPGRAARLGQVLAAAVVAAALALTYVRIFYGIDFTDEAYYVVLPYRLVLGARPFVDETSVTQQTAALLLYPFVLGYHAIAGVTGIVLFVRNLQFALSLLVAAAVAVSLRGLLGGARATLVAGAAVVFVPFDIHSISYDSLASGLLTAGLLLGVHGAHAPGRNSALAAGAVCVGLAAFAYPPLVVTAAAAAAAWVWLATDRRHGALRAALPAVVLPVVGMGVVAATAGLDRVAADYRDSVRYLGQAGGLDKLAAVALHQAAGWRFWYLVVVALAALALAWRRRRIAAAPVLFGLPLLAWPPDADFYTASLHYVAVYGWLAVPLYLAVRRRGDALALLAGVWLPALVAGITTAYSSANGSVNFGVGFFPAAIVTTVFLVWALEEAGLPRWAAVAPALCVLGLLLFMGSPLYRDGPESALRVRVRGGAFAGLLTSPRKRAFLGGLQRDLARAGSRCRILFFDDFPAGYLLTSARPDTNAAWSVSVARRDVAAYQSALVRYYRRRGYPGMVVMMRRIPYAAPSSARVERYAPDEPLLAMLRRRRYRRVVDTFDYTVYIAATAAACTARTS